MGRCSLPAPTSATRPSFREDDVRRLRHLCREVLVFLLDSGLGRHAAESPAILFFFCHASIVGVSVPLMDIDPQAVIDALSRQIGALHTENTVLKMALQQLEAEIHGASDAGVTGKKKSAPKGAPETG